MFATFIHFHPSLIFVGVARSLPIEWSLIRGPTLVSSRLAHKYHTRVEVANTLAYYKTAIITVVKSFRVQVHSSNPIKLFTAVNYGFS